jgi:hypothetical protein
MSATTLSGSDLQLEEEMRLEDDGPDLLGDVGDAQDETPSVEAQLAFSFEVGGKAPTSTMLRLIGGKIEVDGEFAKGETVKLEIVATVGEVAFVDIVDNKTGQVVGCERRHKARIVGVSVDG